MRAVKGGRDGYRNLRRLKMPKGPNGEKRPADANARAVMVAKIATGEVEDKLSKTNRTKSGRAGAKARAQVLTPSKRAEIAKKAADARWGK